MEAKLRISKNSIISELTKAPHGDLKSYVKAGAIAAVQEPEFFSHLMAWNEKKGQVRDSKLALPLIFLAQRLELFSAFTENAEALLACRSPRELAEGLKFAREIKVPGGQMKRLVAAYLRAREARSGWWDRTALQHRTSLKTLYAKCRIKPGPRAQSVLFDRDYPEGSAFRIVKTLSDLPAKEAAGVIMERRIPFLVAAGAMGKRIKEPEVVLALIERMSPTELVTNTKLLVKLGMQDNPALRSAFEAGMKRAATSKKQTFKTNVAAMNVGDEKTAEQLRGLQEKQIKAMGGIDGTWLVLADKSGSMQVSIEAARVITATLAKTVTKDVFVTFFDVTPRTLLVNPGTPYENILGATSFITAGGGTSIGCGLQRAMENNVEVDGIAIVSDGAENTSPMFAPIYEMYCDKFGKNPPVYLFQTQGSEGPYEMEALYRNCERAGIDLQRFDLRGGVDYTSLPSLVNLMRVNRYSLIDEIMETKLFKLADVLQTETAVAA